MIKISEYFTSNKIQFTQVSDYVYEIAGKRYELVYPVEGVLFDKEFKLVQKGSARNDYLMFEFGGKMYFTSDPDHVTLTPLKYRGLAKGDIFQTDTFLGVHGGFEILNGSGQYNRWCEKARFLGVKYLGICEKNTLAGIIKFQTACFNAGIAPILGATYSVRVKNEEYIYDVKCYVMNETGWANLLQINKEVNVINQRFVYEDRLVQLLEGLILVFDPKSVDFENTFDVKGTHVFYQLDTVVFTDQVQDRWYLENLKKFTNSPMKPLPITDAYYLDQEDSYIKETLNKVSGVFEYKSNNQYFKDKDDYTRELGLLFKDDNKFISFTEGLLRNELGVSMLCKEFSVQTGARHLPAYKMTPEEAEKYVDNEDLFWSLIEDGLKGLGRDNIRDYIDRVNIEYDVIQKGKVLDYFLMLHDIVGWCYREDILVGIGRGSAGGSVISMLLGLIHLDPIEFDLLFERFLNEGRMLKTLPDIDTDIESDRRGEVKQYMEQRFGLSQVISVGTYTALQLKASLKDIGKVFNLSFDEINMVTAYIENAKTIEEFFKMVCKKPRLREFVKNNPELINSLHLVMGQPKAKSVHACAMIIFPEGKDMFEWSPIMKQDELYVSEWEGPEMEQVGFLKEDILGVKQLDKFRNIINMVKATYGKVINIYDIPYDDPKVYEYFRNGYNGDIFHFGSIGLSKYCTELLPEDINDLIAGISLYRPGAIENNFHNEYVLRKNGEKETEYRVGTEPILNTTYGVFVYQEQIMKLCQVLGGLSLMEADDVRKAMVKKKYEELTKYKSRFIPHYVETFGVDKEYAEHTWDQIDKASTYLFNKSHAAAYAITGYISQWFKVHYPLEYWVTAFEYMSQDDIKEGVVAQYLSEIDKTGAITVYPVDINKSSDQITAVDGAIYWAISSVKQCAEIASQQILNDRKEKGPYFSFEEFLDRHRFVGGKVNKAHIENLIYSGAFDQIEGIISPCQRKRLLESFYALNKVTIAKGKELVTIAGDKLYDEWWWQMQQKKLSSIVMFDYASICDKYFNEDFIYLPQHDFQSNMIKTSVYYGTGGIVVEATERETKKAGKWCSLKIESNNEFLWVTIFPEQYSKLTKHGVQFVGSEGKMLLVTGILKADDFRKENTMKVWDNSEVLILEG